MYLKIKNRLIVSLIIILLAVLSCKDKSVPKNYIARVGDKYLLKNDLNKLLQSKENRSKYEEELIRDWVEKTMLYEEAVSDNVLEDSLFKTIINKSRYELASSILIERKTNKQFRTDERQLLKYYNLNKNDFKTIDDAVVVNYIKFNSKSTAINFRSLLLNSSWQNAIDTFASDSSTIDYGNNRYYPNYKIAPELFLRHIKNLNPGEIGIVVEIAPNVFVVVQLKAIYKKGDIPEYSVISNRVKERYLMFEKKKLYRNYINRLYSKYAVDIKKEIK